MLGSGDTNVAETQATLASESSCLGQRETSHDPEGRDPRPRSSQELFSVLLLPVLCLVTQSCLTVCDPMDCSPPGSSVHGILQAGILEWVAKPSFKGSSRPRNRTQVSRIAGWFFTVWASREALPLCTPTLFPFVPNALSPVCAFHRQTLGASTLILCDWRGPAGGRC